MDGDQLDRSCEKWSTTYSQVGKEYPISNKSRKTNLIGHLLRRNGHLNQVTAGKV